MASVGSIVGGAFRPFRDQPASVAIWALIYIAFTVGTGALAVQGISSDLAGLQSGMISPMNAIGGGLLIAFLALLFAAIMNCAIYRLVLRPGDGGFASLKVGGDEFRMMGLYLILIVAGIFLGLILALLMVFVMGGAALAGGGSGGAGLFAALVMIAMFVGIIYFAVRLSLVFPMTFLRRRIAIDDGWALSRGYFWKLFLAYLVIWVILIVIQTVVPQAPGQASFIETVQAFRDPAAMQALQARQAEAVGSFNLMTMLPFLLMSAVVQVITNVLTNAASATAVREILHDQGEVLDDEIEETARIFE